MSINNSLKNIYSTYWTKLSKELLPLINKEKNSPGNPLLLQVDEEKYLNSDLKVMIFGQETNGWDEVYHGDIEKLFKVYNDFFLQDYCYRYGGQFWNGVSAFKKFFEKSYPNKKIVLIWNNITKIGLAKKKGKPTPYISKIEHDFFPVIKSEIEILKPDIVIFFTGPYRDKWIEHNLNDAKFLKTETSFSNWQLAQLVSKYLPEKSFRTYHPNYLWRNDFNKYKKAIFELIEKC